MAHMQIVESSRRIGGFFSNQYEDDYVVQRDNGEGWRCFDNYQDAKAYEDYLQELDNQDAIIKSQQETAEECRKTNQLLENLYKQQNEIQVRRWKEEARLLRKKEEQRIKDEEQKRKKREEIEAQRKIDEQIRLEKQAKLHQACRGQIRIICPKIDNREVEFDKLQHSHLVISAVELNEYIFSTIDVILSSISDDILLSNDFFKQLFVNYQLQHDDISKLFLKLIDGKPDNLIPFFEECLRNTKIFPLILVCEDIVPYYKSSEWESNIISFIKQCGENAYNTLLKQDASYGEQKVLIEHAIREYLVSDEINVYFFAKIMNDLNSTKYDFNHDCLIKSIIKQFQIYGVNKVIDVLKVVDGLQPQTTIILKAIELHNNGCDSSTSLKEIGNYIKWLDSFELNLINLRNMYTELFDSWPYAVLQQSIHNIDVLKLKGEKSVEEIRIELLRKTPKLDKFDKLAKQIKDCRVSAEDLRVKIVSWQTAHFYNQDKYLGEVKSLRKLEYPDCVAETHKYMMKLWAYIGILINYATRLNHRSKGLWFSKKRKIHIELMRRLNELLSIDLKSPLCNGSTSLYDYANFMRQKDASLRFASYQNGYSYRNACMHPDRLISLQG